MFAEGHKKAFLPFSKKEITLRCYPQFKFPSETQCGNCNKTEKDLGSSLKACQRCLIAHYCSKKCQLEHFSDHKLECKLTVPPFSKECTCLTCKTENAVKNPENLSLNLKQLLTSTLYMFNIAMKNPSDDGFWRMQKLLTFILAHSPRKDQDFINIVLSMKCFLFLYKEDIMSAWFIIRLLSVDKVKLLCEQHGIAAIDQMDDIGFAAVGKGCGMESVETGLRNNARIMSIIAGEKCFDESTPLPVLCGILANIFDPVDLELKNCPLPILAAVFGMQYLAFSLHKKPFPKVELMKVMKTIGSKNTKLLKLIAEPVKIVGGFPEIPDSSSTNDEWARFITTYTFPFFNKMNGCREYILTYLYPGVKIKWDCGHSNSMCSE